MIFEHKVGARVVALIEGEIVGGEIMRRNYSENMHGNSISYNVLFRFLDGERSNIVKLERDSFKTPEELVQNLLDIYSQNRDDKE